MPKIRGKFAPMFEELGSDERFILELSDNEKLIFFLILCTCYWSNNTAPIDPRYYQKRYGLRQHSHTIHTAIDHIKAVYPKIACKDKKLSLLNYIGYKNMVAHQSSLEIEREIEEEIEKEEELEGDIKAKSGQSPDNVPTKKEKEEKDVEAKPKSLEDCKTYFKDLNYPLEAERFFDYFSSNGWKVSGRSAMRDWKAAARNWIRRKPQGKSLSKPPGEIEDEKIKQLEKEMAPPPAEWTNLVQKLANEKTI